MGKGSHALKCGIQAQGGKSGNVCSWVFPLHIRGRGVYSTCMGILCQALSTVPHTIKVHPTESGHSSFTSVETFDKPSHLCEDQSTSLYMYTI